MNEPAVKPPDGYHASERKTHRESQVPRYALGGRSRRYIAEQLFISENTVKALLKKTYEKMGVHSKNDLERILPMR